MCISCHIVRTGGAPVIRARNNRDCPDFRPPEEVRAWAEESLARLPVWQLVDGVSYQTCDGRQ
jgi:hypothetical protein